MKIQTQPNAAKQLLHAVISLEKTMDQTGRSLEEYSQSLERLRQKVDRNATILHDIVERTLRVEKECKKFHALIQAQKISMDFSDKRLDDQEYEMLVLKRSNVHIENTIASYADAYKINNENISILNDRVTILEKSRV